MNVSVSRNTQRIKGGGGAVVPVFFQVKYHLPLQPSIPVLFNRSQPAEVYALLGIGSVTTALVRIKGSISAGPQGAETETFTQTKIAGMLGVGVFHRLGKFLVSDISAKYIFSQPYNPAIGSVEAYSGFRIEGRLGLVLGSGFAKLKRQAKNQSRTF